MTKPEAIQDAKDRAESSGLIWYVIRIRTAGFRWRKYTYDTVTEHHFKTHMALYVSGHFKEVHICEPKAFTELDLSFLNSDIKIRKELEQNFKQKLINTFKP